MSGLRWLVADSLNHLAQFMLASKLDTLLTSGRVTRLIEVRILLMGIGYWWERFFDIGIADIADDSSAISAISNI